MRILFVTMPFKSHLQPMVPLAWALRSAGHEVQVACEPGFVDTIAELGLTAVGVGPDKGLEQRLRGAKADFEPVERIIPKFSTDSLYENGDGHRDAPPWEGISWLHDNVLVPMTWGLNDEMVEELVTYCRFWQPDLVLCDVLAHAGAVAADAVGAAHGQLLFWLDVSLRLRRDFLRAQKRRPPATRRDALRDWYGEWAKKYGSGFSEELVTGQFAVNVLPERCRLDTHERTLSLRHVPYNDRSVVPSWLRGAPVPRAPRVLMTFGALAMAWVGRPGISVHQVQETLDSLADLDIELILTLSDEEREQLHSVPENTRIVDFVPLDVILPTCSVLIHHGGAGSFNGAMMHGTPQILLEYAYDAAAKRVVVGQTGLGLSIAPDEVTGPRIRESLTRLLKDDAFRVAAERLQQEALAHPTPSALVPELERLTAEHRSHRARG